MVILTSVHKLFDFLPLGQEMELNFPLLECGLDSDLKADYGRGEMVACVGKPATDHFNQVTEGYVTSE